MLADPQCARARVIGIGVADPGVVGHLRPRPGRGAVAQLVYHGTANDYTTGAGVLTGTDNASKPWTIDFSQTALNWTTGLTNGNLINALTSTGVQVVACQGTNGCSLITLQLTLAP